MMTADGAHSSEQSTARKTRSASQLALQALGTPAQALAKARRLAEILASYADDRVFDQRLERLVRIGVIEALPSRLQMAVGAWDMLRFWISPAAADYYAQQNINYAFHQVLRFLDEPASLADPVGFFSTRDGIIGHVMQVVHANPCYDLQLLMMFEDGLDELDAQLVQMMDGTHPRAASIGAIVEEADYHERLLKFLRIWRADPTVPPMLRRNVGGDSMFQELEATFGSLTEAMRYFKRMPETVSGALRHATEVKTFPRALGALRNPPASTQSSAD